MSVSKNDNSTVSLVEEDNGYAKPPSSYDGTGKVLQNSDGGFTATRNTLESEARTANSELSGIRLGNKQVSATFSVDLDPANYVNLFESTFYGKFKEEGVEQVESDATLASTKKYELIVDMDSASQNLLVATVGNTYLISAISNASYDHLVGAVVLRSKTSTTLTFLHPEQSDPALNLVADISIAPVNNLRPAKTLTSFNAEESIFPEDGSNAHRFMTTGVISTGASIDLPSEGIITSSFSMIGSNYLPSKQYEDYDSALTNSAAAHVNVVPHETFDPLVLQDGAIISEDSDTLCQWISGSINIENGAQTFFTGCSYEARGSYSGDFRVTVTYEALFESEDEFIAFESEKSSQMMLRFKDRTTDKCLVLYIPNLRKTAFARTTGDGLVSASITASAVVSEDAVNSLILGQYSL